mmetsp:Transcript_45675/g.90667  ORF Transcript_45675/g.90667 Transcript_45675/m.90667 type:complete len:386 (+) Transcript_45675:65-1222(+)
MFVGRNCANTLRDLGFFLLGGVAGLLVLVTIKGKTNLGRSVAAFSSELSFARTNKECTYIPAPADEINRMNAQAHSAASPSGKYAFVQMAYDDPSRPPVHIWRVLPMARLLQSLSKFPLIVLTNTTHFPDGTKVVDAFQKLDAIVLPCQQVPLSEKWASKLPRRWLISYWKLQIWQLTDYDKLLWVDTDGILFRSIDWLFQHDGEWGQRDNWICEAEEAQQNWLCSGLMLINPSKETYREMVLYAELGTDDWWTNGDQKLIRNYFSVVKGTPVKLLTTSDASFGKCIGHTPGLGYPSFGPWNMPTFIHKSSADNECFTHDRAIQMKEVNGTTVNVCHYHPLGPYWRNAFCEAASIAGIRSELQVDYCNDTKWYNNEELPELQILG